MADENDFLCGLLELQYGKDVESKLSELAEKISWAHGWPTNKEAFWNAEAFMWGRKVGKESQKLIKDELKFLSSGKNLDLGCGAYSYVPSVGFDFSSKMLQFNDQCIEKVQGDLEKELPFSASSFDSITSIFVLNYVKNYQQLLLEIRKVLKEEGMFVMVLYSKNINDWQKQKEVNSFNSEKWIGILQDASFSVNSYEKEGLWFFRVKKRKNY